MLNFTQSFRNLRSSRDHLYDRYELILSDNPYYWKVWEELKVVFYSDNNSVTTPLNITQ